MSDLERFKTAHDRPGAGFAAAVSEIHAGRKQGHWIWYVFPQLSGLGHSAMSQTYGISSVAEAADYLRDPVLRSRLFIITTAVAEQLRRGAPLAAVMGSSIDALKLVSSLTLFSEVARRLCVSEGPESYESLVQLTEQVLDGAASQGYGRCGYTLALLAGRRSIHP
jgi:uncharacterized protein (DUF1810 family)